MDKNNMKASGNEIAVLFSKTMVSMEGCREDAAGCTSAATNQTIIPEKVQVQSMLIHRPKGFGSILAHEIGHQFGLPSFRGDGKSAFTGNLMFENTSYRMGTNIPVEHRWHLRQGFLP